MVSFAFYNRLLYLQTCFFPRFIYIPQTLKKHIKRGGNKPTSIKDGYKMRNKMLDTRLALLTRNYNLRASHVRQVASRKPKAYMRVIKNNMDNAMIPE